MKKKRFSIFGVILFFCVQTLIVLVTIAHAGSISGTVYESDGTTPIVNLNVNAQPYDGGGSGGGVNTDAQGNYTIDNLDPVDYRVHAAASVNGNPYVEEYYNDTYMNQNATRVTVGSGDTPGINFILDTGGVISGTVYENNCTTPIDNMHVFADDQNTGAWIAGANTVPDGTYAIRVPTGTYRVGTCSSCPGLNWIDELYDNKLEYNEADPVAVTEPNTTSDIDFCLDPGGSISGTVYKSDGTTPIDNLEVQAYKTSRTRYGWSITQTDGSYTVPGLPSGNYSVKARPYMSGLPYMDEYYDNIQNADDADLVGVTVGIDTPGIDFVLGNVTSPPAPTLDFPHDDFWSCDCMGNFWWFDVAGATWYQLWVNNASGVPVIKKWYKAEDLCWGGNCWVGPMPLNDGETYTWWIQAWNTAGDKWSTGLNFTIHCTPGWSAPSEPHGFGIDDCQPAFEWTGSDCATWFYLQVNQPGGTPYKKWVPAQGNCTLNPDNEWECSYPLQEITLTKGDHYWWIQPWSLQGYGPWSPGMFFNVSGEQCDCPDAPPAEVIEYVPQHRQVIDTCTNNDFKWQDDDCATWYWLWIEDQLGPVVQRWYQKGSGNIDCQNGVCTVNVPDQLYTGLNTWWVQTWNTYGFGQWSRGSEFIVNNEQCGCFNSPPPTVYLESPDGAGFAQGADVTFQFIDTSGGCAVWFYLWVNNDWQPVHRQWYHIDDPEITCTDGVCSIVLQGGFNAQGDYIWWIQPWSSFGGYGPWSDEGLSFNVN